MPRIGQGGTAPFLDAIVTDGSGTLIDADSLPLIDIINALGVQLQTDIVAQRSGTGLYRYPTPGYVVPSSGALGVWTAHWTTVVNGIALSSDDLFEVVAAGSITFPNADSWVSGASLASDRRLDDVNLPADVTFDMCAEAATNFLYIHSGRRFKVHDVVVRPNRAGCDCVPFWTGFGLGMGTGRSAYWQDTEFALRSPVVANSVVVTIDGVVLSPAAYKVYDKSLLVRTDGRVWPICSHLSAPDGVNWTIAYSWGQPPDMGGILACREYAIHVALALSGKISKIPARATGLTRGGLSLGIGAPQNRRSGISIPVARRTGIPLVDDWLDAVNPHGLMSRPTVTSPDSIRLSST